MNQITIELCKLDHYDPSLPLPELATPGSAGSDIRACLEESERAKGREIMPGEKVLIPTGLALAIPAGYEIQIRPRSGLSYRSSLIIPNGPGTIDSDYRGELKILMLNYSSTTSETIAHGQRIAQMVVAPVLMPNFSVVEELDSTKRGAGGIGHTGSI